MKKVISVEFLEEHEKVNFYTFTYKGNTESEFFQFLDQYDTTEFKEDIDTILYWMDKIGREGALDYHFRKEIGGLKALPIETSSLRVYCFKINPQIVIMGNGGKKSTRTFNVDPVLNAHAMNLLSIGKIICAEIKKGSLSVYNNEIYGLKEIAFNAI